MIPTFTSLNVTVIALCTIHLGCADARRTATGRDHMRHSRDAIPQRIIGLEGPLSVRTTVSALWVDVTALSSRGLAADVILQAMVYPL